MGKEKFVTLSGPHTSGSAAFCYTGRLKQVNSQYKSKILYRAMKEGNWAKPSFHYPMLSMPPVPADTMSEARQFKGIVSTLGTSSC